MRYSRALATSRVRMSDAAGLVGCGDAYGSASDGKPVYATVEYWAAVGRPRSGIAGTWST